MQRRKEKYLIPARNTSYHSPLVPPVAFTLVYPEVKGKNKYHFPPPRHEDIGGVEVQLHSFLVSQVYGGKWSTSRSGHFIPEKNGMRLDGPRVNLDGLEQTQTCRNSNPGLHYSSWYGYIQIQLNK
jgi:hypothetical protein